MQSTHDNPDADEAWRECNAAVERESVQPVLDAGLVDLVEVNHQITEEVWLMPTAGHTPGHVSIVIGSGDEKAVITGDCVHHPCQLARPDWGTNVDDDPEISRQTRWKLFTDASNTGFLILGTHWTGAGGGTVVRDKDAFRLEFTPTVFVDEDKN